MKKNVFTTALVATMISACMAMSASATEPAADAVVLTYAEVNNADSQDVKVANYFRDKVLELTDGSVNIDIQFGGVLGSENDIVDGMVGASGTVDLARISVSMLNNYGASLGTLLTLPYTFENRDHFYNVINTELGERILQEPADLGLGVTGVFFLEEGFRDFFFINEIKDIADFENLKVRTNADPILTGIIEGLGANATVISSNEVYTSLQSGVVDGADQPFTLYETGVFYEVAPYLLRDDHVLSASEVIISDQAVAKLSEDQMAALREAGAMASEYSKEVVNEMETECKDRLIDLGATIIDVEDKSGYREACADIIAQYTEGHEDEYQQILDAAN